MDVVELARKLVQFPTVNPPGDEQEATHWVAGLLRAAGLEPVVLESRPGRSNLICRLPGRGLAPALLMHGHLDVVSVAGQQWSVDPFSGLTADGCLWGRGTLDMKGGVAMMVQAFLHAAAAPAGPRGDVLLAIFADEEQGGEWGAKWMVEQHAGLFEGVRYAIGEFGGFRLHALGRRFYPIMVAEKQICQLRVRIRGRGGHGSIPQADGTLHRLSQVLRRLTRGRLPVVRSAAVEAMLEGVAGGFPRPVGWWLRRLDRCPLSDLIGLGPTGRMLQPLLRHTCVPTVVRAGASVNVVPEEASVDVDCRLVPPCTLEAFLAVFHRHVGHDVDVDVLAFTPPPPPPDLHLLPTLGGILRELDPGCLPLAMLLTGATDGRHLSRLGIQSYGYLPMNLPRGFSFSRLVHAADERVPMDCLRFGEQALCNLLDRLA